jgi:uncharacterized protein with FMN-binding domain
VGSIHRFERAFGLDRAIPTIKSEILSAKSTRVAAASGATDTSMAYAQSVQSALDRA